MIPPPCTDPAFVSGLFFRHDMARNVDREHPIQCAIVDYLKIQYPKALVFSVPNELASKVGGGERSAKRQTIIRNVQVKAKRSGMLPGMADVCMLLDGRFYAFEVKAPGNYQQDNQRDAQAAVEANGGVYAVVRSIDNVKAVLSV
jgi:hypothetical protein